EATNVRTQVAPRTDLSVRLVERLSLRTRVAVPVWVGGGAGHAVAAEADLVGALGRRFGLSAGYRFSNGPIPIEGPYLREHRGRIGGLVHSLGKRVIASHRLSLLVRGVRGAGETMGVRTRIDNDTQVTFVFHPAARLSVRSGLATDPHERWDRFVQIRPALWLHGAFGFGRSRRFEGPAFELGYAAGLEIGVWPVALARRGLASGEGAADATGADGVDVVVHLGLSGRF
ncbi:MAG: hypothetical protein D6705_16140, partial [Deltaproteobacteria bacterium]